MYEFVSTLLRPFPLLFIALAAGVALLWRKREVDRRRLLAVTVPAALLWLLSTPAAGYLANASLEWQHRPLGGRPVEPHAIVVLSGYVQPPTERYPEPVLGSDTIDRCLHAAGLYRGGEPCPVVLSGGIVDVEKEGPPIAHTMRDFVLQLGVDPADVVLEPTSRTTHENAVQTARQLEARSIDHVVLVTEARHMPRAVRCFRAQGLRVTPAPCRYRADEFELSLFTLLPNPHSAVDTQHALHEWLGLVWYRLHGRI